jgi:hypothetical protein
MAHKTQNNDFIRQKESHNVSAVYDVFLRPIRKNAKHFYGRKKMWRRKTPQRAKPDWCFS